MVIHEKLSPGAMHITTVHALFLNDQHHLTHSRFQFLQKQSIMLSSSSNLLFVSIHDYISSPHPPLAPQTSITSEEENQQKEV